MSFRQIVSPHTHQMSFDSASTPASFAKRSLELGLPYMTTTDHGTLQGARQVYSVAKKHDLIPIIGCEFYLRDDNDPLLLNNGVSKGEDGTLKNYAKYFHVTAHFQDREAYETASRLLSRADKAAEQHGSERKPIFTWADLEELGSKNVTFGSSCLIGACQRHLLGHNDLAMAERYYQRLRSLVKPGNFIVEIFPHDCSTNWESVCYLVQANGEKTRYQPWKQVKFRSGLTGKVGDLAKKWGNGQTETLVEVMNNRKWAEVEPIEIVAITHFEGPVPNECRPWAPEGDVQRGCNLAMLHFASKYNDPVVVSPDDHFAYPEDKDIQDIRLLAGGGSWRFTTSYHTITSAEAFVHFQRSLGINAKTFEGWIDNSYKWASGFHNFDFRSEKSIPSKFYPEDTLGHLVALIKKHGRMDWNNPAMVERLKTEVRLFRDNGTKDLLPMFFVSEDFCNFYGRLGKLSGPGRGSSAGVLIAYLLRITHVNPLEAGLSLERFLTLTRIQSGALPDIDQDFGDRKPLLEGYDEEALELTFDDGTTRVVPLSAIVKTPEGDLPIQEAIDKNAEVLEVL